MTPLALHAPCDGWLLPIEDVPDEVFAGRMLGDGAAIDPLGDTLHAPADGTVGSVHAAGHAVTLQLDGGGEVLLHFGLDTVRLEGAGFTPLVAAGDRVRTGDPLLRVALSFIAERAKSLVTPIVLTDADGRTVIERAAAGRVRCGDVILVLGQGATELPAVRAELAASAVASVRVPLSHGLHARPAARLSELARDFDADLRIVAGERGARLRSPSSVLALGIRHGQTVTIEAGGDDADAAVAAIVAMIASGMGEAAPFADKVAPVAAAPSVQATALAPGAVLSGVAASPGLAVGPAWLFAAPEPVIAIEADPDIAVEAARFDAARERLRAAMREGAVAGAGGQAAAILAAHDAMLDDEDILAETHAAIGAGASAGRAWRQVMRARADALRAAPDPHIAERADDLLDLELRLQWQLAGQEMPAIAAPPGAILVADDLMPSQVAALDAGTIGGIVTARGGPTSHVAIIAASRGIPAVVALGPSLLSLDAGTMLVLDAATGSIEIAPHAERLRTAMAQRDRLYARRAAARAAASEPGRTADGTRIEVFANLGGRSDAAEAVHLGAEGCGLLRTEFLFLDRASAPGEQEQADDYAAIAKALGGRPLIVRLLDIGGDKPAPYLPIAPEENPALGMRGIRVGLARPDVLATQLRAILRAGSAGDVRVMVPMVARLEELRSARDVLLAEAAALGIATPPPLGVMVETPAAAVMADRLAAECDFLSIGTNDLSQYTLAMDRGNPAVAASLDGLDPAVLRMIGLCCRGAATHGKWVGVCGGLASDPLAVPILLGLGVTELSAAPAMVAEIKAVVRACELARCVTLAEAASAAATAQEVRALAGAMAEEIGL